MNIEESKRISQALKAVSKKHKDDKIYTFETDVSEMALDASKVIDYLIDVIEQLEGSMSDITEEALESYNKYGM